MAVVNKDRLKIIIKSLISIGLLLWLGLTIRWQELAAALKGIDKVWLLAAVIAVVLSIVISTFKWQLVIKAQNRSAAWSFLWRTYWQGLFLNNFLPSSIGGDALRIIKAGQHLNDTAGGAASVIMERILAMAGIALTGLLGALILGRMVVPVIGLFLVLLAVTILITGLILSGAAPRGSGRIAQFLQQMAGHGREIRLHWIHLIGVIILSVVFQLLVVAVNYCLFRALHVSSVSWWEAAYIIPVTSVIAMIPISINGFGVREGAYVQLLQNFQVSPTIAFSCSLLFAFLVSLCSLYGGLLLWVQEKGETADVESESCCANSQ